MNIGLKARAGGQRAQTRQRHARRDDRHQRPAVRRNCTSFAGTVYCSQDRFEDCHYIRGVAYCGRCVALAGEVYCNGEKAQPAVPAVPAEPR